VDLLGPPVKAGGRADEIGSRLEGSAASKLGIFQLLDGGEVLVDECGVGQWPQVLGGLEFGRVRRQKEQVDVLRHPQFDTGMPARPIEDQHNLLGRTGTRLARKLGQFDLEDRDADGRGQMKEGATRGGMDKADEVTPGKAVLHCGHWPLANRRPDAPQERL